MDFGVYARNNLVAMKGYIHDMGNIGGSFNLTDGVEIDLPITGASRNYHSGVELIDSATSIIKMPTIDNHEFTVELNGIALGNSGVFIYIRIYIPNPTLGDIPVKEVQYKIEKNNIDDSVHDVIELYNGSDSDAKTHGFKFKIRSEGGDVLIKDGTIQVKG